MKCPTCKLASEVLDSRRIRGGKEVWRRRQCKHCGARWTHKRKARAHDHLDRLAQRLKAMAHAVKAGRMAMENIDAEIGAIHRSDRRQRSKLSH